MEKQAQKQALNLIRADREGAILKLVAAMGRASAKAASALATEVTACLDGLKLTASREQAEKVGEGIRAWLNAKRLEAAKADDLPTVEGLKALAWFPDAASRAFYWGAPIPTSRSFADKSKPLSWLPGFAKDTTPIAERSATLVAMRKAGVEAARAASSGAQLEVEAVDPVVLARRNLALGIWQTREAGFEVSGLLREAAKVYPNFSLNEREEKKPEVTDPALV